MLMLTEIIALMKIATFFAVMGGFLWRFRP